MTASARPAIAEAAWIPPAHVSGRGARLPAIARKHERTSAGLPPGRNRPPERHLRVRLRTVPPMKHQHQRQEPHFPSPAGRLRRRYLGDEGPRAPRGLTRVARASVDQRATSSVRRDVENMETHSRRVARRPPWQSRSLSPPSRSAPVALTEADEQLAVLTFAGVLDAHALPELEELLSDRRLRQAGIWVWDMSGSASRAPTPCSARPR